MKNLKKIIILGVISVGVISFGIYKMHENDRYEEIEYNDLINTEQKQEIEEEKKYIILHITGEIINPRDYKNRRRIKSSRCNRSGRRSHRKC